MEKVISLLIIMTLIVACVADVSAATDPLGKAPNAGDGVPDGSGRDPGNNANGRGPAPNAGDCEPDGSGF